MIYHQRTALSLKENFLPEFFIYKIKVLIYVFLFLSSSTQTYSQSLQWRELTSPPFSIRFEDIYFINSNTGWVIEYNKIFKTTTGGQNWTLYTLNGGNRSIGFFDSQYGIVGTLDTHRTLSRTTNGGVNWTLITNFPDPQPKGVCGIGIANNNVAYFCGTYYETGRAYKTTDKGESWNLVFNDTSLARTLIDCYFWSQDSGIMVGGYNTSDYGNSNSVILLTVNGGNSWQRVYKSVRTKEWCWKISFVSGNTGFVSIERDPVDGISYILKTTNAGLNWSEIPFLAYTQQAIGFINENTGWIGGYGNSVTEQNYETTNGGAEWHLAGWGKWTNRIRILNDTLGYACGQKIFKYSRTVGIQNVTSEIPALFFLSQNYPNPFNPVTVISYQLPVSSFIVLKVYDALGKEVATLVNEKQNAGSYNYQLSTVNYPLSSGIYFYKLQTEKFVDAKRMILIK